MNIDSHSDGPNTARAVSSTMMPGSAMFSVVTHEATASNHLPK
jgi:hypothetical protein